MDGFYRLNFVLVRNEEVRSAVWSISRYEGRAIEEIAVKRVENKKKISRELTLYSLKMSHEDLKIIGVKSYQLGNRLELHKK